MKWIIQLCKRIKDFFSKKPAKEKNQITGGRGRIAKKDISKENIAFSIFGSAYVQNICHYNTPKEFGVHKFNLKTDEKSISNSKERENKKKNERIIKILQYVHNEYYVRFSKEEDCWKVLCEYKNRKDFVIVKQFFDNDGKKKQPILFPDLLNKSLMKLAEKISETNEYQ